MGPNYSNPKPTLTWSNHDISPKEISPHKLAVTSHDTANLGKHHMFHPFLFDPAQQISYQA